jgi:hypothetical protein
MTLKHPNRSVLLERNTLNRFDRSGHRRRAGSRRARTSATRLYPSGKSWFVDLEWVGWKDRLRRQTDA